MPTLDLQGRKLHYLDEGQGFPIIFGHSYLWDAEMWRPQIDKFKNNYRCIAPDLWGHGESAQLAACESYSLEEMVADYKAFLSALNVNECHLVGLSIGGMWGALLAQQCSDTIKKLVLCDTYLGAEPVETQQQYEQLITLIGQLGQFTPELLDTVVPMFFSPHTLKNNSALVDGFRNKLASIKSDAIPTLCRIAFGIFRRQCYLDMLSELKQPTLVIVGQDDAPRPVAEARQMHSRLSEGTLEIIPQAGHIANCENPSAFNQVLERFL